MSRKSRSAQDAKHRFSALADRRAPQTVTTQGAPAFGDVHDSLEARRITPNQAFKVAADIVTTTAFLAGMTLAGADARQARSLPASMTGMWGWTAQSCGIAGDDGHVVIKARSVEFFAALYSLENIVVRADGAFHATAIVNEEGEPGASRGHVDLKLVADGRLSIRTDAAGSHTYVRCR